MDQRGYPVDPSEAARSHALPEGRLQAWTAIAVRTRVIDLVPAQDGRAAA